MLHCHLSAEKLYDIEMSRVIVGIKDIVDRYVAAVIAVSHELGQESAILNDFNTLRLFLDQSEDLIHKISSPIFNKTTKNQAIEEIARELKLSELMKKFLFLLIQNDRLWLLDVIIDNFFITKNKNNGVKNIAVILATDIDKKSKKMIEDQLAASISGQLDIDYQFDPNIIGGALIKLGSLLCDASIYGKLNKLKKETNTQILNMQ
jgi:F-type H+-transporting ATPase subunit delta